MDFDVPSIITCSDDLSFIVDNETVDTFEVDPIDDNAVDHIINLRRSSRNRRPPKRLIDAYMGEECIEMSDEEMEIVNSDSDFEPSDVMDDDDDTSLGDVENDELELIKSDFKTIVNMANKTPEDELNAWHKHFDVLMTYLDNLNVEDKEFIEQNLLLPSELTLPFVYEIQDNRRFMKIIEYCYKLHEADEVIED